MGQRQVQEFWDQMWYWEKYEQFPGEQLDDPHLVISLGRQIGSAVAAGQQTDPDLVRRFDACVGRVMDRLTNQFPVSGDSIDQVELKEWLKFGLDPSHRGHDGDPTPIIDANSLVIFIEFCGYARELCSKQGLADLGVVWTAIEATANEVEDEHQRSGVSSKSSRFVPRR